MLIWNVTEVETIAEFLRYRNAYSGSKYRVTDKPDSHWTKGGVKSKAFDAIAECTLGGQPLAIEHTKLDVLHNQTSEDVSFLQLAQPIEDELNNNVYALGITIIFEETCSPKGDWRKLSTEIIECLRNVVPGLNDGSSKTFGPPDYPITFHVQKNLKGPRGAARRAQSKRAQKELVELMVERVRTKLLQLNTKQAEKKKRILLLQMRELSMVSVYAVPDMFYTQAYPQLKADLGSISEIWIMLSVPDRTADGDYKTGCWLISCVYPCRVKGIYEVHFTDSSLDCEWPLSNSED